MCFFSLTIAPSSNILALWERSWIHGKTTHSCEKEAYTRAYEDNPHKWKWSSCMHEETKPRQQSENCRSLPLSYGAVLLYDNIMWMWCVDLVTNKNIGKKCGFKNQPKPNCVIGHFPYCNKVLAVMVLIFYVFNPKFTGIETMFSSALLLKYFFRSK